MQIAPSLAEAAALAPGFGRVPVAASFPAGALSPADCFLKLKRLSKQCFILESLEDEAATGRYSFLGFDPALEITCQEGRLQLTAGGARFTSQTTDPASAIRQILSDNRSPKLPGLPPFTGGLVGYFAYDYIRYAEPAIDLGAVDTEGFRDVDLMLFDKVIAFDRLQGVISIVVNVATDALEENYGRALTEIDRLRGILENGQPAAPPPLKLLSGWRALFDKPAYCAMAETAQRHIKDGDIFQIVLSNRLDCEAEGSLFEAYRAMARANPSPYMFYFSSDDIELAGAAPETLVRLRGDLLETFPLAGTRGRGATPAEDARLERDLLSDPKELAEHTMLVDLGRNDIGRVARFGTVTVTDYRSVQRFSHVMHIGSTVQGRLRPDCDALDAVAALLPAGTLSGAPKIRACQLIGALEGCRRGVYGGAIGYLSLTGDMDTCIAIRLAFKKNGRLFLRSGAGVVADSRPEAEFEECQRKLAAVEQAIAETAEAAR
ncbi:MAG: anthranilate synthase component I family protein [Propionibacteriaceae bacterium]|jgi:anthranilate synthase component 1|nr:anthranilate synthase component I family protein [Propionibacteriaceae bacterium]